MSILKILHKIKYEKNINHINIGMSKNNTKLSMKQSSYALIYYFNLSHKHFK